MGRDAGYLALWCGIANGAERILLPEEHDYNVDKIIEDIRLNRKRGKKHHIIINAEGIGHSTSMAVVFRQRPEWRQERPFWDTCSEEEVLPVRIVSMHP